MDLTTRSSGDVAIIELSGRFDAYEAPRVAAVLDTTATVTSPRIVVDLAGVPFIDSTALGTLVRAMKRCRQEQGDLHVSGLQPSVSTVFTMTRLDRVFKLFATEGEAVRAFGP
jgi:anti-sigma B factor antagonist